MFQKIKYILDIGIVLGFGEGLGYGTSFDSYIPKLKTFGNDPRGFITHI